MAGKPSARRKTWATGESWSLNYPANWQRFKLTKVTFWILLVAILPAFVLIILIAGFFKKVSILLGIPAYFVTWLWIGLHVDRWKCPRCGERFSKPVWGGGPNQIAPLGNLIVSTVNRGRRPYLHLLKGMDASAKKGLERRYEATGEDSCDKCGLPMT